MTDDQDDRPMSDRERLVELRDLILESLRAAEPREVASLAKQYRDTLADIAALPAENKEPDPLERAEAANGASGAAPPR